jgi:hypothetical protein
MAIRNSVEIGENLVKIANLLIDNSRLCRLLKYTDKEPFSEEHDEVPQKEVLHKNIKIVPLIKEEETNTESVIAIVFKEGEIQDNKEFKRVSFDIMVYVPLSEWILNDINLRPFLIISEIEKSLKNKRIQSLGTIDYKGFEASLVTDILSCHRMRFEIDVFN